MEDLRGTVVISLAGRDKGRYLVVISSEEGYVYLADGKLRSVASPKKKSIKHISITKTVFREDTLQNDKRIRNAIQERFIVEHR